MALSPLKTRAIQRYAVLDYSTAMFAWFLFWGHRQDLLGKAEMFHSWNNLHRIDFISGIFIIPLGWLFLYLLSGTYFNLYRKSRLHELNRTLVSCILGSIIVSLIYFADDSNDYSYFIKTTARYFLIHSFVTIVFRMLMLNNIKRRLISRKVVFNTLIVGGNNKAIELYKQINDSKVVLGNKFVGFIYSNKEASNGMSHYLPQLGHLNDLEKIIDQHEIEEVILAIDSSEHHLLENIITRLSYRPVVVKVLPDLYDIISGSVKTSNVYDAVLIHIYPELMPDWQRVCKRTIDIVASILALIIYSPIFLFAAIKVKLSSPGPIIYKQKRIGRWGKSFYIYKFRSMVMNAEEKGPALSSDEDPRITPWGKVMRKWRIDELPQFYNILKGEMSLVGPRPERQYFIDIISNTHPHYKFLHKVKPGLTSWGMVQYGYATNVHEMIDRMKYDLLYIENCSLALDVKIMVYTLKVIFQGRGK